MFRQPPNGLRAGVEGFTLVELLIAVFLLVVGLVALFGMLDVTTQVSVTTRARETAVTLAREISEDAHAIPYDQIAPATISTQLQSTPGLVSTSSTAWQVSRRGITYTINASECAVDDPKDGYGAHDSTFCADSAQTGTTDTQPIDFKRLTVDVTWAAGFGNHAYREVTTLTSAGQAASLTTSALALATPSPTASGMSGTTTQPVVSSTSNSSLTFSVTAPSGTTAIIWTVNGSVQTFTSSASGTTWTSSGWNIASFSDGTYQVGAAAQDAAGVIGPAVTIPVRLARTVPTAPKVLGDGFNANLQVAGAPATAAELQWQKNPELNVTGYRIYNPSGTLICTTTASPAAASCGPNAWCTTSTLIGCVDLAPPATTAANLTYKVAALYYDAANNLQQGPSTSVPLSGSSSTTFSFAATTQNTASNCAGSGAGGILPPALTTLRDMVTAAAGGTDTTVAGNSAFCSAPYASGQQVTAGGTASAYFANPGSGACTVTATFSVDGTANTQTATATLPAGSAIAKYTFNFPSGGLVTMGTGDRLDVALSPTGTGCGAVLHVGSASYPSGFQASGQTLSAPGRVPSVSVTAGSGNSASVSWGVPTGGTTAVSFYRVYRDSSNYGGRYAYVDASSCSTTCTFIDSSHSASHSYWVTAVGGTAAGSNMAESAATGPATG